MLVQGDALHIPLPSGSVHCVVTSPPYWGLRKYSGDQGDEPLGLEATPERHIERTVLWAREVYRVLRDDGVFWLNYGDCYATTQNGRAAADIVNDDRTFRDKPFNTAQFTAAGNLMLMPHRIALALQADGWIVRQDLVWYKRNPMPESVNGWRWQRERVETGPELTDWELGPDLDLRRGSWRHTRAHEYVFMLCKEMGYWSNQEAVREVAEYGRREQPLDTWDRTGPDARRVAGTTRGADPSAGRNPRSVLDVPTAPYRGAHYATFPPNLIAPLIRATCPRWACPVCGQGWAPEVERVATGATQKMADGWDTGAGAHGTIHRDGRESGENGIPVMTDRVIGHRPTCDHEHTQEEAVPGICFDPFVGSGTTVAVARELLRRGIGLDISRPYLEEQAKLRTGGSPVNQFDNLPLFDR